MKFDSVYMLMFPGWRDEMRSNRWHYASRWARRLPVVLIQPELLPCDRWSSGETETRFENTHILPIRYSACDANQLLLETATQLAQVKNHQLENGHRKSLLWLFNPWLAPLFLNLPAAGRIMHATEDWYGFPDTNELLHKYTDAAVCGADGTVCVSNGVAEMISKRHPKSSIKVVTNGCDFSSYSAGMPVQQFRSLADGYKKLVVFAGNIDLRLDYDLLLESSDNFNDFRFLFAGRLGELDPRDRRKRQDLFERTNVEYLGEFEPDELPDLYASCDLGLIAFKPKDLYTRRAFSLKTLEMAAAGLPVVSTRMDQIRSLSRHICVTEDSVTFLLRLSEMSRANLNSDERQDLVRTAKHNDYDVKFEEAERCVRVATSETQDLNSAKILSALQIAGENTEKSLRDFANWYHSLDSTGGTSGLDFLDLLNSERSNRQDGRLLTELLIEQSECLCFAGSHKAAFKAMTNIQEGVSSCLNSNPGLRIEWYMAKARAAKHNGYLLSSKFCGWRALKTCSEHFGRNSRYYSELKSRLKDL